MPQSGLATAPPPPNASTPSGATTTGGPSTNISTTGNSTAAVTNIQNQSIPMSPASAQGATATPTNPTAGAATNNANARKKTSFQITSVKVHDGGGVHERDEPLNDSGDPITHEPTSATVTAAATPSAVPAANLQNAPAHNGAEGPHDHKTGPAKDQSITDPQAVTDQWSRRFRVVKIPFSEPFKRGRWTCTDFFDPLEQKQEDKQALNQVNTSPGDGDGPTDSQGKEGTPGGAGATPEDSQPSHLVSSALTPAPTQTPAPTPQGQDASDGNYAASGDGSIDKKIEQAMDLVKSHLIFAVREEVDVLREKITELNERSEQLSQDNQILRSLLTPEQAQRFSVIQQQQQKPAPRSERQAPVAAPAAQSRTAPSLAAFAVPGRSSGGVSTLGGSSQGASTTKPVVLPLATTALTSGVQSPPATMSSPSGGQPPTASLPATLLVTPTKEQSPVGGGAPPSPSSSRQ